MWISQWDGSRRCVDELHPASRAVAGDLFLEAAERDPAVVVGLDFSFSVPLWWLRETGLACGPDLWEQTGLINHWLASCDPPFWGRSGRPKPDSVRGREWRETELAIRPRPRSVFQLSGAGSVGAASLRGMETLRRLRRAGFCIWPFDPWNLPAVVEAWPRLSLGPTVKSRAGARSSWLAGPGAAGLGAIPAAVRRAAERSDDAFDALAALRGLVARGTTPRPPAPDEIIAAEGWIDGVPYKSSSDDPGPDPAAPRTAAATIRMPG